MEEYLASLSKKKLLKEYRQLQGWTKALQATNERSMLEYLKAADRAERLEREIAQLKSELRAASDDLIALMAEE